MYNKNYYYKLLDMSVATVPLNKKTEAALDNLMRSDIGSSKAEIIRRAINKLAEDQAILDVLEAEQEVRDGKIIKGDLRTLAKKIS